MQSSNNKIDQPKKKSLGDEIAEITQAIMIYNQEQSLVTNRVVPAYSLINKISEKLLDKAVAKKSFDSWYESNKDKLGDELANMGIKGMDIANWNGKHHRKTMDTVIDSVISILNRR